MHDSPLSLEALERSPFGTVFADAMAVMNFRDHAWSAVEIKPVAPLSLHPAAHVLHYASTCFEGLKAYRWNDDSIRLFRLDRHVARMRRSAELLCLPCPEAAVLDGMIRGLVEHNRAFVPRPPGALYIRPTLIGVEANIGAAGTPAAEACLFVLTAPVGAYFKGGERGLKILIEDQAMRAVPGFGQAKTGGNYAAALRHVVQARRDYGADQVLFCPGGDVQETGASNFLLLNDREILTKPLSDAFLHGVTRDSVLRLAAKLGYQVTERDFTVAEIFDWIDQGGEATLSGTAAVLAGVGTFIYQGQEYTVGNGGVGRNALRLRQALTAIQYGEAPDEFGWLTST
jgi:branched-chain amino acid aminotransferase